MGNRYGGFDRIILVAIDVSQAPELSNVRATVSLADGYILGNNFPRVH